MTLEYLDNGNPEGCTARGKHQQVIASASATETLTESQSGSIILIDRATLTYTLPTTSVIGTTYTFQNTISGDAGSQQVNSGAATIFLVGAVLMAEEAQTDGPAFVADGVADIGIDMTTDETGAALGGSFTVTRLTSTLWGISGILHGTGVMTTPFTT